MQDEFKSVILLIEESILATDLAIYFKNRTNTFSLLASGSLSWSNTEHKRLVRGLLMTACDLGKSTSHGLKGDRQSGNGRSEPLLLR